MHPRQASLFEAAQDLVEKTAAKRKQTAEPALGPVVLWKYLDPEGRVFYLEEKKLTLKSPFSGKSFTTRPTRFTPAQVGQEIKQERKNKQASEDPWKV
jgi:hypothetical protein